MKQPKLYFFCLFIFYGSFCVSLYFVVMSFRYSLSAFFLLFCGGHDFSIVFSANVSCFDYDSDFCYDSCYGFCYGSYFDYDYGSYSDYELDFDGFPLVSLMMLIDRF